MLSGGRSSVGRSFGVEASLPAARPCIARGETLHLVKLAAEHMFVQTAGETDVKGSRRAADDAGVVASPLSRRHEGIEMLRLRTIVLRTIVLRSA
jgi:hypothetical protein